MMKLVKPNSAFLDQIAEYKKAFQKSREVLHGSCFLTEAHSIEQWIEVVEKFWSAETVPNGYAPCGTWLLIRESDKQMVGITNLRFELNSAFLQNYGGHIGYSIKPAERRKGYGSKLLELTLKEAKKQHITRVLITCDDNNIASARVIEANNGKLENTLWNENEEILFRRYWITN